MSDLSGLYGCVERFSPGAVFETVDVEGNLKRIRIVTI
jgi:hypothetical protein